MKSKVLKFTRVIMSKYIYRLYRYTDYTKLIYDCKKYNRNIMWAFYRIITLLYFLFFTHCIPFEMVWWFVQTHEFLEISGVVNVLYAIVYDMMNEQ